MMLQAVFYDIYGTLLEVEPGPADAASRWQSLCRLILSDPAETAPTLAEFNAGAEKLIALEHRDAQAAGIDYPEIYWPVLACQVWPALAKLEETALDDFLFRHANLQRTVHLLQGAAEVLRFCSEKNLFLGLVSNAQPYTLRELDMALDAAGLTRKLFVPDLCYYSFAHGFSKPDPHVWQLLAARLAQRGLRPEQALVVGDRADMDVTPARRAGFQAWQLSNQSNNDSQGSWAELRKRLGSLSNA